MSRKTTISNFFPIFSDCLLKMAKTALLCLVFLCFGAGIAAAQANELEAVLESPAVTYAQASRFVIASSGVETNARTQDASFAFAKEKGWVPDGVSPQDPIKMADLSFLITSTFGIEGGLMYKFFPGPRYAFRAMVSRSLIQGSADPSMTVSGQRFLHILGNTVNFTGGEL